VYKIYVKSPQSCFNEELARMADILTDNQDKIEDDVLYELVSVYESLDRAMTFVEEGFFKLNESKEELEDAVKELKMLLKKKKRDDDKIDIAVTVIAELVDNMEVDENLI